MAIGGDERDLMIFSPVVARRMTESAARWVENPRNLVNVAITRARDVLFFVADYAVCRRQPGASSMNEAAEIGPHFRRGT